MAEKTTPNVRPRMRPKPPSSTGRRLSVPLVAATLILVLGGVAVGFVTPVPTLVVPEHDPRLNAWPAHVVVTVLVLAALAGWAWWDRRQGRPVDPLASWRRGTAARLAATVRRLARGGFSQRLVAVLRVLVMVLALLVIAFTLFRMGFQVSFTRHPAQTVNAWGGPSYLGAFYAHGIDAVLTALVAGLVIRLVTVRGTAGARTAQASRAT